MRKFRVWCIDNNEWEKHNVFLNKEGHLFYYNNQALIPLSDIEYIVEFQSSKEDRGKSIYQGDIVKFISSNIIGEVKYNGMEFYIQSSSNEISMKGCDVVQVGNIHENPNLLETAEVIVFKLFKVVEKYGYSVAKFKTFIQRYLFIDLQMPSYDDIGPEIEDRYWKSWSRYLVVKNQIKLLLLDDIFLRHLSYYVVERELISGIGDDLINASDEGIKKTIKTLKHELVEQTDWLQYLSNGYLES